MNWIAQLFVAKINKLPQIKLVKKITMVTIRNQQLKDLQDKKQEQFVNKAQLFIKTNYPLKVEFSSDQDIEQCIRSGMKRANRYNLLSEKAMIAFIELMYILTKDFDTNAKTVWTKKILSEDNLSESQKINIIINQLNTS